MTFQVFCKKCLRELDYEDLNENWCSNGNHTLLQEIDGDFAKINQRCLVW